jgi:DNA-binding response OmpR family regulator
MPNNESSSPQVVRFGTFELDVRAGELRRQGVKIKLQEQPLRTPEMLLAHPESRLPAVEESKQ